MSISSSVPEINCYPGVLHGLAVTHDMKKVSPAT